METRAILRGARISAQKGRLVADLIRGKPVDQAMNILGFMPKKGAAIIRKNLNVDVTYFTFGSREVVGVLSNVRTRFIEEIGKLREGAEATGVVVPLPVPMSDRSEVLPQSVRGHISLDHGRVTVFVDDDLASCYAH